MIKKILKKIIFPIWKLGTSCFFSYGIRIGSKKTLIFKIKNLEIDMEHSATHIDQKIIPGSRVVIKRQRLLPDGNECDILTMHIINPDGTSFDLLKKLPIQDVSWSTSCGNLVDEIKINYIYY